LELLLGALALIVNKNDQSVRITILGDEHPNQRGYRKELLEIVRRLGIETYVRFVNFVDHRELKNNLSEFDIGFIGNEINEHTNTTIPGKLFEYMAAGLAILSSDLGPVRTILQEVECGYIFSHYSTEGLAECVSVLQNQDKEQIYRMGQKGKNAVQQKYNWQIQSKPLVDAIDSLVLQQDRSTSQWIQSISKKH
jgi:glycosyltransferase involved in cell wall biosynthesis